jgi:deazaflavin-dependent oxidoreductase (nitroreductase family)
MPLPRWLAQINKRTFNKMELRRGVRPVLTHVGRSSGKVYHTPLDAHRVDNGFIFIMNYGSGSDWAQNVLSAGSGQLKIRDEKFDLVAPRLIAKDVAWQQLPNTTKAPPERMNVEYLQMDLAE